MEVSFFERINIKTYVAFLCLFLLLESCSSGSGKPTQNEIALPVYRVDTSTVVLTKNFVGTVEGKTNVEVRPQVTGELKKAYVDEGDHVKKGQRLFKINPRTFEQDLEQAKANANVEKAKLDNAKLQIKQLKPLVEHKVMSPVKLQRAISEYQVAKAKLKQAKAKVANARIKLGYTTIKAPVSGYIGRIPKRIGNLVSPGDDNPITTLTDVHEVYAYFSISQSDFFKLLKTQSDGKAINLGGPVHIDTNRVVSLILPDGTVFPKKGVIDASSGQINKATGSINMRATFANKNNILRSGNTVTLVLKKKKKGVITIPQKATFKLQTNTFVEKLTPQNRAVRQLIAVGTSAPHNQYTVKEGLKRGDRILAAGLGKVTDSTKINPLPYQPDTLVSPKSNLKEDSMKSDSLHT
jgi:membrane fusion protein (multidrug efflux system)